MLSSSAPKDQFFEKVFNPYLAEVLQHPQTIETREGLLHIRDVEGPRKTGRPEARLEALEQEVFKCQEMVERGLDSNHIIITEFTTTTSWTARTLGRPSSSFMRKSSTSKPRSVTCKIKTVSMNIDSKG